MDKAKIVNKIQNMKKIKGILEIAKFDTIQKLAKISKISDHHYEASKLAKDVIVYATTKYNMSRKLSSRENNKGKLFIYITISSKMMKVSYNKLNEELDKKYNQEIDSIIAVGKPAIIFAKKKMYNIVQKYEDLSETSFDVESIVNKAIANHDYSEIHIIARTPKLENNTLTIFPFKKDVNYNREQFKKVKFYSSLSNSFENISSSYVRNIIKGIYQETYKLFYKQKLIRHEDSIKRINQILDNLKLDLVKLDRKKETEDMILVSKIAKG